MYFLYFVAKVVHLFLAIGFVGYFLLEYIFLKSLYPKIAPEAKSVFAKRKVSFIFISIFGLFLSGLIMANSYLGGENGYFNQPLQIFLSLKIILSILLLVIVLYWYLIVKILQKPLPFKALMHPISFVLLLLIVLCSKMMFY